VLYGKAEGRVCRPQGRMKADKDRVSHLRVMLWAGQDDYAIGHLRKMYHDPEVGAESRFRAAIQVATWLDLEDRSEEAAALLEDLGTLPEKFARSRARLMRLAQLHFRAGRIEAAKAALADIRKPQYNNDVRLVLANLATGTDRLDRINEVLSSGGFAPIACRDTGRPPSLDNIGAAAPPSAVTDMGLVSVIMPAFSSEDSIATAIRSVLEQSYRNIELIVVDDRSPDGTAGVVERLAAKDDRVTLLRQPRNAGAYPARNAGLAIARGDFITTHDADDWSHPQKLERQLAVLRDDPALMGVVGYWARVRDDLEFTSNWRLSDRILQWNHSSFMFRRKVVDDLGGWENVRVSADTEFIWRIEAAYGKGSFKKIVPTVPMSFALDSEGSLTRVKTTHVGTIFGGVRHYYRAVSRYWHQRHPGGLSPELQQLKDRMIPREMFDRAAPPLEVALHLTGDCSDPDIVAAMRERALEAVPALVGVSHIPDPTRRHDRPDEEIRLDDMFFELLRADNVRIALLDNCEAGKRVDLNPELDNKNEF